jgi:hypothetical protein
MKHVKFVLCLAAITSLISACGAKLQDPGTDSSTHWLSPCAKDSTCGVGFQCVCGSCTRTCDTTTGCDSLGGLCAAFSCLDTAEPVSVCSKACTEDSQCPANLQCAGGACQLRWSTSPAATSFTLTNSSAPDAGTSSGSPSASILPVTPNHEPPDAATPASPTTTDRGLQTAEPASPSSDPTIPSAASSSETPDAGGPNCPATKLSFAACGGMETDKYYWNGTSCEAAPDCECTGSQCSSLFTSRALCVSQFAACVDEIPVCTDYPITFNPLPAGELPPYSVRLASESPEPAASTWTSATWSGPFAYPETSNCTPGPRCPQTRSFHFKQDAKEVNIEVLFDWINHPMAPFSEVPIDVMIFSNSYGLRELRVRAAGTQQPLFWVAGPMKAL